MTKLIKIKFSNFDTNLKKTINHYIKYYKYYIKKVLKKMAERKNKKLLISKIFVC